MSCVMLSIILVVCSVHAAFAGVQVNPNTAQGNPPMVFTKWPNRIIPVRTTGMSNAYPEYPVLLNAMNQISLDLGYCVNFTIYNPTYNAGQAHLIIQNRYSPTTCNTAGDSDAMCSTFPGYTAEGGSNGQVATMFGSQTGSAVGGCLDNQRDAMRILVNALGLRNEYLREDRGAYMTFPTVVDRNSLVAASLQTYNIFADSNRYNSSVAIPFTVFDYNSITMVSGSRFAGSSKPVFTIPGGNQVGQLARLSLGDCNTLKILYNCPPSGSGPTPVCVDPYASTSGVSLTPNPTVLTRTIQCATSTSTASTTGTPYQIGAFQVNGLNCDQNSQATATIIPSITGLAARLTKYAQGPTVSATTNVLGAYARVSACNYVLEFTYTGLPATGQLNQQLTVNIQQIAAGGVATTVAALPVTLNLNCAPQFTSVTAYTVGVAPALAYIQTRTLGGTAPSNNIQLVSNPNPNPVAGPVYTAPPATMVPYLMQYFAAFGHTGPLGYRATTGTLVQKVFVNCVGATLTINGGVPLVGTNIIGQVQAVDPEGGDVSYFIGSEAFGSSTSPAERWQISQDGILSVTGLAPSPPLAANVVANQIPGDNSAGQGSPFSANGVAGSDSLNTAAAARSAIITAVDAMGGKSTIQITFFLSCGSTA